MTPKQKLFAEEYLKDLNATQSAIRAGYSKRTAYSIGQENLKKPEIQKEIQRLMDKRSKINEITADNVLQELASIAFADSTAYAKLKHKSVVNDVTGETDEVPYIEFTDTDDLSEEQKKAISAIKYTRNGIAVETHNKLKALELLGKHLGMFEEQQEEQQVIVTIKGTEDYAT